MLKPTHNHLLNLISIFLDTSNPKIVLALKRVHLSLNLLSFFQLKTNKLLKLKSYNIKRSHASLFLHL